MLAAPRCVDAREPAGRDVRDSRDAETVRCIATGHRERDRETSVLALAYFGQRGAREHRAAPWLAREPVDDVVTARRRTVRQVQERSHAARCEDHVGRIGPRLEPCLDHQGLDGDDLVGGLVPVIRAHHQQHLLAPIAQAPDGIDDDRDVRVRRSHQRAMLDGAELHDMLGVVGLAEPERVQRVPARRVERGAEPAGGLAVAGRVIGDVEMLRPFDRLEAGTVRAAAVQQQTVSVRILHVGGSRRGVEPAGRSAVIAKPLAQGGAAERASRRAAQPFAKRRRPHRDGNEPVSFVERDDVAVQSVGGGEAPGRQGGGVHPGRGGEDRAVAGVPARGRREPVQVRSERIVHVVAAQAVDHDEDRAALSGHGHRHGGWRRSRFRSSQALYPTGALPVRSAFERDRSTRRRSVVQAHRSATVIDTSGNRASVTDSESSGRSSSRNPRAVGRRWTSRLRAFRSISQASGIPCRA